MSRGHPARRPGVHVGFLPAREPPRLFFLAAGADGIFVPGAVEPGTVRALVAGIDGPLNVMVGPGAPTEAEPAALGVARISAGAGLAQAAHAPWSTAPRGSCCGRGPTGRRPAGSTTRS
ncbi:isocitrate lyase/phosphoenolpyruvate mutase family protein [Streptomyces sp. NPDC005706]|uniref:isocitrate lyase/phosphoenolpyruvate mutase family protein n=1 Tax=Streptomyces sp. NPDC005706 TaxID=3157169 RepID=UPI0033EE9E15